MWLSIHPGPALHGEAILPGDKSLSHRAALFAALANGTSTIDNFLVSGVTSAMLRGLQAMGVPAQLDGTRLTVQGTGWQHLPSPSGAVDCGNSATTLRLLAGAVAAAGVPATLDGSAGLRRRPMGRIVEPLQRMGAAITTADHGGAPLRLAGRPRGRRLHGIEYTLPVASAQVKSCLLLAALAADAPVTLHEPGPSRDHTERMLSAMGVELVADPARHTVVMTPSDAPLQPLCLTLPGDISSAAFLIAAALLAPGSHICLRRVGLNPTRTGLLDAFRAMGADIAVTAEGLAGGEPVGDLVVRYAPLHGTTVAGDLVVRMIDEFPVFAVVAAAAQGVTEVREAAELRHKESDRLTVLCRQLTRLGVAVEERPDGFRLCGRGQIPGGATVSAEGDHRLAMSLALAGLASRAPVRVEQAEILAESFPDFTTTLTALGAQVETAAGGAP